jgi:serine protease
MKSIFKVISLFAINTLMLASCSSNDNNSSPTKEGATESQLSNPEINSKIVDIFKEHKQFDWKYVSDQVAISAFHNSNNLVSVAWDAKATTTTESAKILDFVYTSEGKTRGTTTDEVLLMQNNNLNVMLVKIYKDETFLGLRKLKEAEVVEPAYQMYTNEEAIEQAKKYPEQSPIYTNPQGTRKNTTINYPSNFGYYAPVDNHNIPRAWAKGLNGKGIEIAIIDGGLIKGNNVFGENGNFNGANVQPRAIQKWGFFKSFWDFWKWWVGYDGSYVVNTNNQLPANHGTDMARLATSPLGNETGVAYNANLITIRSSWGVWIDPIDNVIGVSKAYEVLAYRSEVKIISMSQGAILNHVWIERAIKKCYENGKLMFAAGGTFIAPNVQHLLTKLTGFTLFPARMDEVNSCTGIKKLSSTNNKYEWGDMCFGTCKFAFEFNEIPGTGINSPLTGSSSNSTSNTAGMAALIWSKDPSMTREQVLEKMIKASDFPVYMPDYFGHGRVDMAKYLANEGL